MAYPSRPTREVLPQFRGDLKNGYNHFQRDRFDRFVAERYVAGLSLREIAELTGRTQTAVRASLDRTRTPRRARGAPALRGGRDGSTRQHGARPESISISPPGWDGALPDRDA